MRVIQHTSATAFLAQTEGFRAQEPVLTNIIGSVATGVAQGRVYDSELWLTVHEEPMGVPVGIAMRTAPHNLVASPMSVSAAHALGERLALIDPLLPGVSGTPEVTAAIVAGLGAAHRAHTGFVNLVRVLGELHPPRHPCPGRHRAVVPGDHDRVVDWLVEFGAEAGLHVQPSRDAIRADLLAAGGSPLWVWDVEGDPVSLGGHAPLVSTPVGTVARIGPVYTPVVHRGHGYGTAITHAVAEAFARDCAIVLLYTDAANVTSNDIYAQLGFAEVAKWVEVTLDPSTETVTTPV